MPRANLVSLLLIVVLVAVLADREPDTSAELFPLASAVGWVEGHGRDIKPDLVGVGIRPPRVVRIGSGYVPRTPPAAMLCNAGVCKIYRGIVGRPLDGADIPKLSWWINFLSVLPWALLLFGALRRLAVLWGQDEGTGPEWAAWAVMCGSLALGWFGVASPYLPVAALGIWTVVLILEASVNPSLGMMIVAGLMAGFSGAAHPSGWLFVLWGVFYLFATPPAMYLPEKQTRLLTCFAGAAAVAVVVTLIGNAIFFGSPLPVQFMDMQPPYLDFGPLARLAWHDLVGWNGVLWLAPLVLAGIARMMSAPDKVLGGPVMMFLLALLAIAFLTWGVVDDSRLTNEIEQVPLELSVIPVELSGGEFSMVQIGSSGESIEERRSRFERLIERTDVLLWIGGRSPGIPLFLPAAVLLAMLGWCWRDVTRFWSGWTWAGVRWGGLMGLFMSQAPYGSVSDLFFYLGLLPGSGHIPILEAILAVSIRLAEYWPSGIISF